MGYLSRVQGALAIEPPLNYKEVKATTGFKNIRLYTHEDEVHTEDGVLTKITAPRVEPITEDSFKAYELEAEVERIVKQHADTHLINGVFTVEGEDQGDVKQITVRGNEVTVERPVTVWPSQVHIIAEELYNRMDVRFLSRGTEVGIDATGNLLFLALHYMAKATKQEGYR